ncbi:MAG: polymer-forming cytoskeletal protein [Lysobacterales bacterium]|nr:MAG: polymer-forming cytoskeletal protein [Xanthomonadales bacterium]
MFKKTDAESKSGVEQNKNATSRPTSILRNREPTPIGPSMHIIGHIRSDQDLIVHGHIEGTINLGEGLLTVSSGGQVVADVNARVINIEGRAEGKLQASEQIIVRCSGRVRGSIRAPRIALDFGCAFSGSSDTDAGKDERAATRDDKIADFKSAISISGDAPAKSAVVKASPR